MLNLYKKIFNKGEMKMIIKINEYINTAFVQEDIDIILPIIKETIHKQDEVILDFENVKFFTTLFVNTVLTTILDNMSLEEFKRRYKFINLSEYGENLVWKYLDNCYEYYAAGL